MAEPQPPTQLEDSLLNPTPAQVGEEEANDPILDHALHRLDTFLLFLGFRQSSLLQVFFSWAVFILLGVLIPVLAIAFTRCSNYGEQQITYVELYILVSQVLLASVSLICVSHSLRKYGTRKLLFVDHFHGQIVRFRREYVEKIQGFFCVIYWWILPCLVLKTAREILRVMYIHQDRWWHSVGIFLALVVSWVYLSMIFLSGCGLFNLICNLRSIHFEDYMKLLEGDADALTLLEEHMELRYNLSKISHRFRIFLLLAFLFVTASQIGSLFLTTGYHGIFAFISSGDFAVSSIVQVVGIILCLHAAAKISHRAQGIAAVASRQHALATCSSTDAPQIRASNSAMNLEADPVHLLRTNYSESDLESVDNVFLPANRQLGPFISSYHKRQALVMYLQSNPGGLTIFGWTVDRVLINTIFFIELSLVLFVLGKIIVFTSK